MSKTYGIKLYGIKNCDTVKKARHWLESNKLDYQFHDLRSDGLERQQVEHWVTQLSWDVLLNKRSTTWKNIDENVREAILNSTANNESAINAMVQQPTLIKRPVLEYNDQLQVGFKADQYTAIFHDSL